MNNSQKKFDSNKPYNFEISIKNYQASLQEILNEKPEVEQLNALSLSNTFENLYDALQSFLNRCKDEVECKSSMKLCIESLKSCINVIDVLIETLEQLFENFMHQATIDIFINNGNLPVCTLQIIYASYQHCQLSEKLYGTNFPLVSNLLVELFQKTFNLQKAFTSIFGKCHIPETTDTFIHIDQYLKVSQLLFDITIVVRDIDHALLGTTWKLLICFLVKCKTILCKSEIVFIQQFMKEIIENGKKFSNQCKLIVDENKEEAFNDIDFIKSIVMAIRMTSFFLELFNNLVSEYGNSIISDVLPVVNFLSAVCENLQPIYIITPSMHVNAFPAAIIKAVSVYFVKEIDRCLNLVAFSSDFPNKILNILETQSENCFNPSPVVRLVLTLRILKYSSRNDDIHGVNLRMFSLIFQLQDQLYPYFIQSALCYFDNADGNGSLLSEVISTDLLLYFDDTSCELYPKLEELLLPHIISANTYNFQLAMDIWCKIFRSASVVFQKDQVMQLIEIVSTFNLFHVDFRHFQIGSLLKKFFSILPSYCQQSFIQTYPLLIEKNVEIWFFLGSSFVEVSSDSKKTIEDICCLLRDVIRTWLNGGGRLDGLLLLINFIRGFTSCLKNIRNELNDAYKMAFSCCKLEIFDLWKSLSESSDKAPHSLSLVYDELASLTSLFLPHNFFDQHEILTILQISRAHMTATPKADEWRLHRFAQMLTSLRFATFSQDALLELVSIWREILFVVSSSHWLLRHKCLDEFEVFSKSTKHPEIICQICTDTAHSSGSCVNTMVKSHLRRDLEPTSSTFDFKSPKFEVFSSSELSDETNKLVTTIKEAAHQLHTSSYSLSEFDKMLLKDTILKLEQIVSGVK